MYTLPVAVDVYWKTYAVPAAQIPDGAVGTAGLPFLQFNQHRLALMLHNEGAGAANAVLISEKEYGFATAFPFEQNDGIWSWPFPPRTQMFVWKIAAGAPDFRYMEGVYQPFRKGVSPEHGGGVRSNVQGV